MAYIITKATRSPAWASIRNAYQGPACLQAGVTPGKVYNMLEDVQADAAALTRCNPVGFRVWKLGHMMPVEDKS